MQNLVNRDYSKHTDAHTHTQHIYAHTHTHTHTQTEAPVHTGTTQNLFYTQLKMGSRDLRQVINYDPDYLVKKTGKQTHPLPLVYHEPSQDSLSLHLLAVWLPWRCGPSSPEGTPLTLHSADLSPKKLSRNKVKVLMSIWQLKQRHLTPNMCYS